MIERMRLFQLFLKRKNARLFEILNLIATTANLRRFVLSLLCFIIFATGSGILLYNKANLGSDQKLGQEQIALINFKTAVRSATQNMEKLKPYAVNDNRAKIVLIIADLGSSSYTCQAALQLPKSFTLGFKARSNFLSKWVDQAHSDGFESLLQVPLQSQEKTPNNWGSHALFVKLSGKDAISDKLFGWLGEGIGINSLIKRLLLDSGVNIAPKWEGWDKETLIIIKGNSNNDQVLLNLGDLLGVQNNIANIIIDEELDQEKIKRNLLRLEQAAIANGQAIGFVRALPFSQRIVEKWSANLNREKIQIVPASSLFTANSPYIMTQTFSGFYLQQAEQTPVETETNENTANF